MDAILEWLDKRMGARDVTWSLISSGCLRDPVR